MRSQETQGGLNSREEGTRLGEGWGHSSNLTLHNFETFLQHNTICGAKSGGGILGMLGPLDLVAVLHECLLLIDQKRGKLSANYLQLFFQAETQRELLKHGRLSPIVSSQQTCHSSLYQQLQHSQSPHCVNAETDPMDFGVLGPRAPDKQIYPQNYAKQVGKNFTGRQYFTFTCKFMIPKVKSALQGGRPKPNIGAIPSKCFQFAFSVPQSLLRHALTRQLFTC